MLRLKINGILRECEVLPLPKGCFAETTYDNEYFFPPYIVVCAKTDQEARDVEMDNEPALFTGAVNYWWRDFLEPIVDPVIIHTQLGGGYFYRFLKQEKEGNWPKYENMLFHLKVEKGLPALETAIEIMLKEMNQHQVAISPEVEMIIEKKLYLTEKKVLDFWDIK